MVKDNVESSWTSQDRTLELVLAHCRLRAVSRGAFDVEPVAHHGAAATSWTRPISTSMAPRARRCTISTARKQSIEFLKYDLVNLALSPARHPQVGRDWRRRWSRFALRALLWRAGYHRRRAERHLHRPSHCAILSISEFSGLRKVPGLTLTVDDARSWFAATDQTFDLIQMSMIDTWAATGAGAFTLSENGLYTLEGWRAFTGRLSDHGVFTVSRWYNPYDVSESGRMIALATGDADGCRRRRSSAAHVRRNRRPRSDTGARQECRSRLRNWQHCVKRRAASSSMS